MDVIALSTSPSFTYHGTGSPQDAETESLTEKDSSLQQKYEISERAMMDLKEVQDFLYMMVGSALMLKSKEQALGSELDTVA